MGVLEWLRSRSPQAAKCIMVAGGAVILFGFMFYTDEVHMSQTPFRLGSYVPDDDAESNMVSPRQDQSRRKALLEEYCQKNSSSDMSPRRMGNFFVSDRYKVLYCKVARTGSTTTSALLYNLEFGTNFTQQEYLEHQGGTPILKRLTSYTKDEQMLRLKTYKKLLVVRNPLERLVSAYLFFFGGKDYFVGKTRHVLYNQHYQDMLETIDWKIPHTEDYGVIQTTNEKYHVIPFLAFIRAVTEDTGRWENEHWALMSNYCPPCQVHFDFIAHTETLAKDLNIFFQNAGVTGRENVFPHVKTRLGKRNMLDLYRQIPIKDIQRIGRKYAPDFDMFGYSLEDSFLQLLST
ncbi:CHST10 [Branchiostoma lanceolatum]|uniref:Carbohydrate sulfotransferase n=1 Tax=Branchiostoma lanceolatum TaxID=7740 RepID=A0A8K0EHA6_BRALA|nr:CHST10 [Branchiostoma lanceolatum]